MILHLFRRSWTEIISIYDENVHYQTVQKSKIRGNFV
jgi:hypothetical protein